MMCRGQVIRKKDGKKIFFLFHLQNQWRKESDPDTLIRGTDSDPHQNVTEPQHWYPTFTAKYPIVSLKIAISLSLISMKW